MNAPDPTGPPDAALARGRRILDHTADVGFEVWGATFGDALAEAAVALFDAMGDPAGLAPAPPFDVEATGVDREDLVVRLLAELLARFEIDGVFVTRASCVSAGTSEDDGARAAIRCEGGHVDRDREPGLAAVKAVTYHGLRVSDEPGRVRARVYLDV